MSGSTDAPEGSMVEVGMGHVLRHALVSAGSWSVDFGNPPEAGTDDGILNVFGGAAGSAGRARVVSRSGNHSRQVGSSTSSRQVGGTGAA